MRSDKSIDLLYEAKSQGVDVVLFQNQLQLKVPKGKTVDARLLKRIKESKDVLIGYLKNQQLRSEKVQDNDLVTLTAHRNPTARIPLSFGQERLWFIDRLSGSVQYHMPLIITLQGSLNEQALHTALQTIVNRHEILRTVIGQQQGEAYQTILAEGLWRLHFLDAYDCHNNSQRLQQVAEPIVSHPFDLSADHMLRAHLLRLSPTRNLLILTLHHIACDGWSMPVIGSELARLYRALVQGQPAELPPLAVQYADYALWQRRYLSDALLAEKLGYWQRKLHGVSPLNLPTDYVRPVVQSTRGSLVHAVVEEPLTQALQQLSAREGVTLFMTLLAAFKVLLHRYSAQRDICVGVPIAGRQQWALEGLVGFFVNTLALRSEVTGGESFVELLSAVRQTTVGGYDHQEVPFEKVVDAVAAARDMSRSPLFQVMFDLENAAVSKPSIELPGLVLSQEANVHGTSKFDLSFSISQSDKGLAIGIEYCTALYRQDTVERMAGHYSRLLAAIAADPGCTTGALPMLSAAEEQQLTTGFNQTAAAYPKDKTILDLFREQVLKHPQATAVVFEQQSLTYTALDVRSNQLGHYLQGKGVKAESLVAVCLERGVDLMVAIMGILKAGGAYVPVDPAYPDERIAYMLEDSAAALVVSSGGLSERLGTLTKAVVVALDAGAGQISLEREDAPGAMLLPSNLAYVIYTSGSTGKPKGVMIEHKALANLVNWHIEAYEVTESSRATSMAGVGFDAFGWEVWPYLSAGASVFLISDNDRTNLYTLTDFFQQKSITHTFISTALVGAFIEEIKYTGTALQFLLTGGEKLTLKDIPHLPFRFVNNYGPTENTVVATNYFLTRESRASLIGKPVGNTKIYILDALQNIQPVGIAGEIYISGAGTARGYLNRAELTAERFVKDPFSKETDKKMYRSGDIGRWLSDGNIEYLGRMDDQVKIRGFRVELGEIEHVLRKSGFVNESVVTVKEDAAGSKCLVGHVVAKDGTLDKDGLQNYLKTILPEYMIPLIWVQIQRMPVTPNGKIDRRALQLAFDTVEPATAYAAPRNDTELKMAAIWQELLETNRVGINDNFFQMGGHSILAIRLSSAVQKNLGLHMQVTDVFNHPTIAALLMQLDKGSPQQAITGIIKGPYPARIPLSFGQERLWFIDRLSGSVQYHMPLIITLQGSLDEQALHTALQTIVNRHEILRTVIGQQQGEAYQTILAEGLWRLHFLDAYDCHNNSQRLQQVAEPIVSHPFDLSADHMLRAHLLRLSPTRNLLILTLHHIACDGWSMPVIGSELARLYRALVQGQPAELPPLAVQYADYALWQRRYLSDALLAEKLGYWQRKLHGVSPLNLPTDYVRPVVQSTRGSLVHAVVEGALTRALQQLSAREGVTLFMTLLAAFKVLLHRYSGQRDICVGVPIAGRQQWALEGLVGFFVNTLALRSEVTGGESFVELLSAVRQTTLGGYDHQEVPFEKVVDAVAAARDMSRSPLFQVMFDLENAAVSKPSIELPGLVLSQEANVHGTSKFDLSFSISQTEDGLSVEIEYCTALYRQDTVERMAGHYSRLLAAIAADPGCTTGALPMLSAAEEQQLTTGFNQTAAAYPTDKTIIDLFREQVLKHPQATAVVFEQQSLTYTALDVRSNQLGHYLQGKGVKAESLVAVCLERGVDLMVAILGILKAGGAYVPVDPAYPDERIAYMLEDSAAALVVSSSGLGERLGTLTKAVVVALDAGAGQINLEREDAPGAMLLPSNLAYVIYTSGSTGKPKGVMIEHGSLFNISLSWRAHYKLNEKRPVLLSLASLSFDVFTGDLCRSMLNGGMIILVSAENRLDMSYLYGQMHTHKVNLLESTPALIMYLINHISGKNLDVSFMDLLIAGSDIISAGEYRYLHGFCKSRGIRFINSYGLTEATIDSSYFEGSIDETANTVPIGRPMHNTSYYVLDGQRKLVPQGVAGELYIGGRGLGRGYLHQDNVYASRFVQLDLREPGTRAYRTGDMVRWLPDGNAVYLGRVDDQVKIRGYRIALGEIENVLKQSDSVREAVVVTKEDKKGNKRLVAYIVPEPSCNVDGVMGYLQNKLPDYMVPSFIVQVEHIPLTANGKLDRNALPDAGELSAEGYVAPRTETDQKLAEIWQKLLGIERIGIHDNFFLVGGNSLLAINLINQINTQLGISVPLKWIFETFTIQGISDKIQQKYTWRGRCASENKTDDAAGSVVVAELSKSADLPPFFFAAPLGGILAATSIIGIVDMIPYLKNDVSFYGIQAPALRPDIQLLVAKNEPVNLNEYHFEYADLGKIVEEAVTSITAVQPEGPYLLGGFCTGCVLTVEIAKKLTNLGKEVKHLVLIDPPLWVQMMNREAIALTYTQKEVAMFMAKDIGWVSPLVKVEDLLEEINAQPAEKMWEVSYAYLRATHALPENVTPEELKQAFQNKFYNDIIIDLFFACSSYAYPEVKTGNTLILSVEGDKGMFRPEDLEQIKRKGMFGNLEFTHIPGDHSTLFLKANLSQWAGLVSEQLQK